ncbi:MAG: hypothetical protein K2M16_10820 [Muribaculaceae bacterium]|nr:hypothetical protein [Muribaculaceae bacterium]
MKHCKTISRLAVVAIAGMTLTACISGDNEPEKPFTVCPIGQNIFYACGISKGQTRSSTDVETILFSEEDIVSFNVITREIKFKDMEEPIYLRLEPFHEIEFHLGDQTLFTVSSFVGLWDSRVFDNIVLCYGNQESITLDGRYYLYDCYPLQLADTEAVKANREKNKTQWETFIRYLDSKGKLTR